MFPKKSLVSGFPNGCRAFDFKEYDAPVLEPLDLYIEKSGEEIVGQLFHFEDKGERRVALRPELTPTLARMVAARANSLPKPIKWFNVGEHFRYERPKREEGVPFINSTRTCWAKRTWARTPNLLLFWLPFSKLLVSDRKILESD